MLKWNEDMTTKHKYYNFKQGGVEYNNKGVIKYVPKGPANLLTEEQINNYALDSNKEYYVSIYQYNDTHKQYVDEAKTVAKITDVVTTKLVWDFDGKDLEQTRQDALELGRRLIEDHNINPDDILFFFSGGKGMHVEVLLDREIGVNEFKSAVNKIAEGLDTFDKSVFDYARMFRLPNTLNRKSGLYKIPLHIADVDELSIEQIKELAKSPRPIRKVSTVKMKDELFEVKENKKEKPSVESNNSNKVTKQDLDMTKKPKGMQDYVFAILEGLYNEGERHQAMMVLAAKCRAMGYDKEQTYYLCKSSIKKQARRLDINEFDKLELWDNIIEKSIYSDRWEGGSYSPKNNPWLASFCDRLNIKWNNNTEANIVSVTDTFNTFENFASNIDNLTIKTGIRELDENMRLTVGMSSGLVASPGVGKSSLSLQILNNMSKNGHRSVFFSYDMYAPIVYQKLVQKHFNIGSKAMFEKFKTDEKFRREIKEVMTNEYNKVSFCFKTGQTINDIIDSVKEAEDISGEKVKFIVVDYNELVITDYSDPTQSSAYVAQKMREIAQSMDTCVFSLFQPSKISGTPADEIKSYHAAKGSGAISQAVSIMLGMSRPGYDPKSPESDRYVTINCLKNRMGPLFSLDFTWHGLSGTIGEMSEDDRIDLQHIRDKKKLADSSGGGWT